MNNLLISFIFACSIWVNQYQQAVSPTHTYALISDSSVVEWKGASPKVSHHGSFAVTSEGIEVAEGQIVGGTFIIPIETIRNFDLPKAVKPVLLKHLKSKDFFHVSLFPEARFTLTRVEPLKLATNGAVDGANVLVSGEFTMLGITHPMSFPAKIHFQEELLTVEATFTLDRTRWGMTHAADPALGNRHIFPEVDISLKVYARK